MTNKTTITVNIGGGSWFKILSKFYLARKKRHHTQEQSVVDLPSHWLDSGIKPQLNPPDVVRTTSLRVVCEIRNPTLPVSPLLIPLCKLPLSKHFSLCALIKLSVKFKHFTFLKCLFALQAGNYTFNRAKLMNAGLREAMREEDWDCLFFHDVDLIPEDDRNTYVCDSNPKHAAVAMDKFGYKYVWERPLMFIWLQGRCRIKCCMKAVPWVGCKTWNVQYIQ